MKSRRNRRSHKGTVSVSIIVVAFLIIMSTQIYKLKEKDEAYAVQYEELKKQYDAESERAEEIEGLAEDMQSQEYIEDVAKSKLGLVYDNEIVFKEKEE
ncbi:MAG: septum formation initiator family protein [Agathobacter sp.]|nr:septum formation initiator family protein [Agathobacter sp.]